MSAPTPVALALAPPLLDPRELVAAWLGGRSERTREAYGEDLVDFRRFVGAATGEEAAELLLGHGAGRANALALGYRSEMLERGLAPNTINRRLSALRSLVGVAQLLGRVEWALLVKNVRTELRLETRGPGEEGVRAILAELGRRSGRQAARDVAILRLFLTVGLRRFEVAQLDLEHLDVDGSRLSVRRKGKRERAWLELPPRTMKAIMAWLGHRGRDPGPLFLRKGGGRLSGDGLYRLVRRVGAASGVPGLRPHKLRHSAATLARRLSSVEGIGIEEVCDFTGHADVATLQVYLDREKSRQGEIARLVDGLL